MQKIAIPKNATFKKGDKPNRGKIIIEPCYPGYGITLGNSLRRVLLSSLPGAAPIGIKIEGADHEFMTIPHLKEDVLEFILKLKQLRLKVLTEEKVKLELEVHGEREVKASDIKKNSLVEIANPELVLGHITDVAGSLKAEIFVSHGIGYEMIENRQSDEKEIDYIEMDSIFSPVIAVGINIENVRVGKMTNWDRLILDITTDGTITPQEAFEASANILIEQYNAILSNGEKSEKKVEVKPDAETDEEDKEVVEKLGIEPEEGETETGEELEEEKPKKKRGRPKKS